VRSWRAVAVTTHSCRSGFQRLSDMYRMAGNAKPTMDSQGQIFVDQLSI
jgi:hypothetical protein